MRRSVIAGLIIPVLGLALLGAPCSTTGPTSKDFGVGALVIPMDNCYQKRDSSSASGGQTTACNVTRDDGIFRAYGFVYMLLKHNVRVYWAIDAAAPKGTVTGVDVTVSAPGSGSVVKKLNWSTSPIAVGDYTIPGCSSNCGYPALTQIKYIGAPFIIAPEDRNEVLRLLNVTEAQDPVAYRDFLLFRTEKLVDIHEVQVAFTAPQVRPLSGPPPKLAILNINPFNKRTSVDVMYRYARAAGLDWVCTGNGDCAGGVTGNGSGSASQGCKLSAIQAYLTGSQVSPTITDATFNAGPGQIYDILCDNDFYANSGRYADTQLSQKGYKLLWAPHWEEGIVASQNPAIPPVSENDRLALQLQSIAAFVNAGNNLFAECHAIVTLEGGVGSSGTEYGLPITRFQSTGTNAMTLTNADNSNNFVFNTPAIVNPNTQIGDFVFGVTFGSVSAFLPNATPTTSYYADVTRLITESTNGNLDVATTRTLRGSDGAPAGTVAYLGGHNYNGQTAGTRIVLNTLFNMGFACSDPAPPNNTCSTGGLGECAAGVLKCAAGALSCVQTKQATTEELCDGKDNNCDGVPGQVCSAGETCNNGICIPQTCADGATKSCYDGPAGTAGKGACKAGVQTCSGGAWSSCQGQVLPGPAVCNGKDNDCSGAVDTVCPYGLSCVNGVCISPNCGEGGSCSAGYVCNTNTTPTTCVAATCGSATCAAGTICQNGTCVDPCANVTCPQGTTCTGGTCQAGGCYLTGCPSGQVCSQGVCQNDLCSGVTCPDGTFCRAGDCIRSCQSVVCPPGQACGSDGFCQPTCSPACAAGQYCNAGTCEADPCAGIVCGGGQVCSGGSCVDDPCMGVTCSNGTCINGQCPSQALTCTIPKVSLSTAASQSSGGCSSGGASNLFGLLLLGLGARLGRRRSWSWVLSGARSAALASLVLLTVAAGCKGSTGGGGTPPTSCPTGQKVCGNACIDITTDIKNCGTCGCSCPTSFICSGGSCVKPTGNPHLLTVTPSSVGPGGSATLALTGDGFAAGAKLRITGLGLDGLYDLSSITATSATLSALSLAGASIGTAQIRVVNDPGGKRLVSNALPFRVNTASVLQSVTPAVVRQDQLAQSSTSITLRGVGFVSGLSVTLALKGGTTSQTLTSTFVDSQTVQAQLPSSVALGIYNVTITNPGVGASNALLLAVVEGAPVLTSMSTNCAVRGTAVFMGSANGQYFYPTSKAHVSGGQITDAILDTSCTSGADAATGQCQGGQVSVTADLRNIPNGTYQITIVNPGSPALKSSALSFNVKDTCP